MVFQMIDCELSENSVIDLIIKIMLLLSVSGGTKVTQFNSNEPISNLINSISTLFFKDNYMKLYNFEFAQINYSQDIANGINFNGKLEYSATKTSI